MINKLGVIKFWIKYWTVRYILYLFVLPKHVSGAEIGVRDGRNARSLYKLTKPISLFLADSYKEEGTSTELQDGYFQKVSEWTKNKRALILRLDSTMAARVFPELDWIYIDADHTDLFRDLVQWVPKIRRGGVMMGDDYNQPDYPEVARDVKTFCKARGIKLHTLHQQWWFKV